MTHKRYSLAVRVAMAIAAATFSLAVSAQAQTESVIFTFTFRWPDLAPPHLGGTSSAAVVFNVAP